MKSEVSGSDKFISYVVNLFWLSHNFLRLTYLMHQILLQPHQRIKMTTTHNMEEFSLSNTLKAENKLVFKSVQQQKQ